MNVTAKHGQAAIHLGGHEINNEGHYASACGINATANTRFTTRGYRNVQKLRPTEKAVTCKRCLKYSAAWDKPSTTPKEAAVAAAQPTTIAAKNSHMSPTAQALIAASAFRDDAMRAAFEAEGTDQEATMDAAYEAADAAYKAAKDAHRAARIAHGDRVAR